MRTFIKFGCGAVYWLFGWHSQPYAKVMIMFSPLAIHCATPKAKLEISLTVDVITVDDSSALIKQDLLPS